MTDSAKPDTAKAQDTPGPGAASTAAEDAADSAATPGGEETSPDAEQATPDIDDVKRKFREALDRKHQIHTEAQGKGGRDTGKVNGAHGPAASRRNFRRKSG